MTKTGFLFLQSSIIHNINYTRIYYEEINCYIESIKSAAKNKLEELSKESEEIFENYADSYIEEYETADSILKVNFINSVILNAYTILENSLNRICREMKNVNNYKLSHTDLKGDGVQRSLDYLKKVAEVDIKPEDKCFITELNLIRNIIAHANGKKYEITNDQWVKQIEALIKKNGNIKFDGQTLVVNDKYIELILDRIINLFRSIGKEIENRLTTVST